MFILFTFTSEILYNVNMSKHVKAIFVTLVLSCTFSALAQDALQNQRIDELFRRYDSLTAQQNQLNQKVDSLDQNMQQAVQSFDNSVNQLGSTVAQLAALVANQNNQQGRALSTEALTSFGSTSTGSTLTGSASVPTSFALPNSIFPNPATSNAGISGNYSATPGVVVQPQPVAGVTTSSSTPIQQTTQNNQFGPNVVMSPVAVYGTPTGVNTANASTPTISGTLISGGVTLTPTGPVSTVSSASSAPVQSGITHVYQATAFAPQNNITVQQTGIQNINGSSATLPTGSFSPNAFPGTQSQLAAARYLQVGAYTDYRLAANHATELRRLSYPVSERQEGIWLKLLIGPLPLEQINTIKGRLDSQGINSFVTQ